MIDTNERRTIFAEALNKSLGLIVSESGNDIGIVLTSGLRPIADAVAMDQIVVFRVLGAGQERRFGEIYRWSKEDGGTTTIIEELRVVPEHPAVAKWIEIAEGGNCINIHTGTSSDAEAVFLTRYGVKSLLLSPIITKGGLWGAVAFQDHTNERYFDDLSVEFLSSAARICANAFIIDETAQALKRSNELANTINKISEILLAQGEKDFKDITNMAGILLAGLAEVDRFSLTRNTEEDGALYMSQIYRWERASGGTTNLNEKFVHAAYRETAPEWERMFKEGKSLSGPVCLMPEREAAVFKDLGTKSALATPIQINGVPWGFALFEDQQKERYFDEELSKALRSAAFLFINAVMRAELEKQVKSERDFTQKLIDTAPIGLNIWDDKLNLISCNDAIQKIFGKPKQYFIDNLLEFSPEYQSDGVKSADGQKETLKRAHDGEAIITEWEHCNTAGESIPCEVTLTRVDYNNRWIILAYIYDLRNIKKMEKAVLDAEQTQTLIDAVPLCCTLIDKNLNILTCNKSAVEFLKLSKKEDIQRLFTDFTPEYQPDGRNSREVVIETIKKALDAGYIHIPDWTHRNMNGELFPCEVTLVRVEYSGDHVIAAYTRDMRVVREAEAKVREANERAQIMFETAPFASFMFDKDYNVLDCNQEIVKLFEIPGKEFYFKNFSDLSPEYQPCGTLSSKKAAEDNQIALEKGYHRFEWMCQKQNGELLPAEVTLLRVNYKDEYAIAGYIRDLTEKKAAEQLTKEVMEKTSTLTAIFNSTPDMIFCKDINLYYTECNKAMENYFNVRNADIVNKAEKNALNIPPHIADQLIAVEKKVITEGQPIISEEQIRIFDGRMLHFEMIRSPLIQEGKVAGLVGMARDITQRKSAEEELNRQHSLMDTVNAAAAVLLEPPAEVKDIANSSSHGSPPAPDTDGGINPINRSLEMVCQNLDADRVYLWQNVRKDDGSLNYRQIYKWISPEYAIDNKLAEFSYEKTLPYWNSLFSARESLNGPIDTFPENERKFLSQYNVQSILAVPLFFKGELWGFVSFDDCHNRRFFSKADEHTLNSWGLLVIGAIQRGKIMLDLEHAVTEAKRASSEAMKAYAEAENALEAKGRFIANMNHEMRTPMNVIVGLTDLMLEEKEVPDKTKNTLQKINIAGNTLMGLINDVLDISKVEAGKMDLMQVEYHVASMLNDIIALNTIRAEDKPVVFKLDINANLPASLFGDDLRVKQILNNLLSNAFKYTKEGIVTLGVDCQWDGRRHDGYVWVSFYVSDTGIGIRKEDVAKLFTDYNQVDTRANRTIKGTGLGLSITKKFVELMDGEISVESEYGKGSTFRVRIRQGFVTGKSIGKEIVESLSSFRYLDEKKQEQKNLMRPDLSYARVLVVDDFPTNLDVAAGMLRKYKMQVDCVMSGQESIDLIAVGNPVYDAIFMDHMMPGMDGVETVKVIRALGNKYAKNVPIIALTANVVAESEKMFLENGFNAFLPKPFNVMSLDSVVQHWIRQKRKEK